MESLTHRELQVVRCSGRTVLKIIPEKEAEHIVSRLSRMLTVTGAAYAGTLQDRACFEMETGWLRIDCPSLV